MTDDDTTTTTTTTTTHRYAIVEQMGHRRFGARISETEVCGVKLLRCEVLAPGPFTTDVHPQSLFALTPCSEEQARRANTSWTAPEELRHLEDGRGRDDVLDEDDRDAQTAEGDQSDLDEVCP